MTLLESFVRLSLAAAPAAVALGAAWHLLHASDEYRDGHHVDPMGPLGRAGFALVGLAALALGMLHGGAVLFAPSLPLASAGLLALLVPGYGLARLLAAAELWLSARAAARPRAAPRGRSRRATGRRGPGGDRPAGAALRAPALPGEAQAAARADRPAEAPAARAVASLDPPAPAPAFRSARRLPSNRSGGTHVA